MISQLSGFVSRLGLMFPRRKHAAGAPGSRRCALALHALLALGLAATAVAAPAVTGGEPRRTGYAVASIISERQAVAPGDVFMAALRLEMDPEWHVYWLNPGDSGLPPSVAWTSDGATAFGEFVYPAPWPKPLEGLMQYGFGGDLVLPFEVRVPADAASGLPVRAVGEASWLICKDICVPEDTRFEVSWPVSRSPEVDAEGGERIAESLARAPARGGLTARAWPNADGWTLELAGAAVAASAADEIGAARLYPFGEEISNAAPQPARLVNDRLVMELAAATSTPNNAGLKGVIVLEPATAAGNRRAFEIEPVLLDEAPADVSGGTGRTLDSDLDLAWVKNEGGPPVGPGGGSGSGSGGLDSGDADGSPGMSLQALATALLFAFVGGLVLNLMPCVLPVLSIKALSLVKAAQADAGRAQREGVWYLAGVLVCFAAIGVALVALRAAGEQAGLGFQLQSPIVVACLALVMLLVGLNMSGVFELGQSLVSTGQSLTDRSGAQGAFFTGLLAAVVGAPCVGPFMATAVGALVTQPAQIVVLTFLVIGMGMALPVVLLSLSPGLRRFVPRPGQWMQTFRQFLAFPMYLTAAWLLWVLAAQTGADAVTATLFAAVLIAFCAWLYGVSQTSEGRPWSFAGRAAALAGTVGGMVWIAQTVGSPALQAQASVSTAATEATGASVQAIAWSPEVQANLQAQGKGVFVDFTARWCVTCLVNKRTTLGQPAVQAAFAQNNVAFLVADWTDRNDVIAAELARHGWAGVPLYLYYPAGVSEPQVLPQLLSPDLVIRTVSATRS